MNKLNTVLKRLISVLGLTLVFCIAQSAQNSPVKPSEQQEQVAKKETQYIRGIILTEKEENIIAGNRRAANTVSVIDLDIPGGQEGIQKALQPYLGKELTQEELKVILKEIINYYKIHKLAPITVKVQSKKMWGIVQITLREKVKEVVKKKVTPKAKKAKSKKGKTKKAKAKKPFVVKGIFITGDEEDIIREGRSLNGVQIQNLLLPCGPESLESVLEPFIGIKITKSEQIKIRKAILKYYKKYVSSNFGFAVLIKSVKKGVLQILIKEQHIGKINYKGSKWISERQIARIFRIHPGERINQSRIKNNLAWLNQNIFHRSTIKFKPSKESPGDLDIELTTKDRFPIRFYTTANNNGIPITGRQRFSGGITWGNAFLNDDILTYELISSNAPSRFISHTGNYLSHLPWKHRFSLFGNYTKIQPNIVNHKNTTFFNQLRARYAVPIKPLYKSLQHAWGFGFDMKYLNADTLSLVVPGTPHVVKKLQVAQFVGTYYLSNRVGKNYYWVNYNVFWSPGQMFRHQTSLDFEKKRPFSKSSYAYFYLHMGDIYKLPMNYSFATSVSVQVASDTLPITELFMIGGYNTVRGYKPYEFVSDNGFIANFELRCPPVSLIKHFSKLDDRLTFLGFFDYGVGYNYHARVTQPTEPRDHKTQYALGTGVGLRYQVQQYLSFRCDYGRKLHHLHATNKVERELRQRGDDFWYLGLLLAY